MTLRRTMKLPIQGMHIHALRGWIRVQRDRISGVGDFWFRVGGSLDMGMVARWRVGFVVSTFHSSSICSRSLGLLRVKASGSVVIFIFGGAAS